MKINEIIVEGWFWPSKEEKEANAKKELERQKEKENEKGYFAYLSLNGARTGQEKDDYDRLWDTYGYSRSGKKMSHVEIEKYEQMYRQDQLAKSQRYKAEIERERLQDPRYQKAHERAQIQAKYDSLKKREKYLSKFEKKVMQDLFNQGAR